MKKSSRNYGIDLLRIVSILFVIFLHILGHGGVLKATEGHPFRYAVAWLLETMAYPAVNCFVLISGYVGFRNDEYKLKIKNLLVLWLTVWFYSVSITCIFRLLHPSEITSAQVLAAFLPVTNDQYWFFTYYFIMFLFTPLFHWYVHKANKPLLAATVLLIFACFSVYSNWMIGTSDPFGLERGYSATWFSALYIIGAVMKKYRMEQKVNTKAALAAILTLYLVSYAVKIKYGLLDTGTELATMLRNGNLLITYISPTILLIAIGLLCVFSKWEIRNPRAQKIISVLSASAFSVYLIHDNIYTRTFCIKNQFALLGDYFPLILGAGVVAAVICIFPICTGIDRLRIRLFDALHINIFAERIENKVYSLMKRKTPDNQT